MTNAGIGPTLLYFVAIVALAHGCPSSCSCLFLPVNQYHVICINAQLSSFPGNIPSQTTYLSLATNSISSINANDLVGLGNLQILDLSDNQIETIDDDAFLSLTELEELYLEENELKSFGPQHVQTTAKLVILDLSSNPYLTLDECFLSPLDKLETLRLSGSPINFGLDLFGNATLCTSYRCNALSDMRCHLLLLKELDISDTLTDQVPVELFLLTPNLEKLSLARNGITFIPDDAFVGLNSLQDLSLNYNNMTNVNQRTLNGLGGLTKLELGNLGLVIEADIFDVLPNLSELSLTLLGQDVIDSLALSVANTNVTKLNLHHNFLVSIPASMSHISTITSLDLSQNAITHVPEREFSSSLKEIDLSHNNLDSLHQDAFDGLSQLETLKLCYNELAIVPSSVFDPIPLTTTICLGQNPWVCNCTMLPIIIDSRHDTFPTPQCSSPTDLSGRPFSAVNANDLNCIYTTIKNPTVTTISGTTAATVTTTPTANSTPKMNPTLMSSEVVTGSRHTSPFVHEPSTLKSTTKYSRTTVQVLTFAASDIPSASHNEDNTILIVSIVMSLLLVVVAVLTFVFICNCKRSIKTKRTAVVVYSTSMPHNVSSSQDLPPDYESILPNPQVTVENPNYRENTNILVNVAPIGITHPITANNESFNRAQCNPGQNGLCESKAPNGAVVHHYLGATHVDLNTNQNTSFLSSELNEKAELSKMYEDERYASSLPPPFRPPSTGQYLIPDADKDDGNKRVEIKAEPNTILVGSVSMGDVEHPTYECIPSDLLYDEPYQNFRISWSESSSPKA